MNETPNIRHSLSPAQRLLPLIHTIDPGFVNHRRIQTILGHQAMHQMDEIIRNLPKIPEWQQELRINHIYTQTILAYCTNLGIRPLESLLATGDGVIFCSTETLAPCPEIHDLERCISVWVPHGDFHSRVEFHYSTKHICSDTMLAELEEGGPISIIAEFHRADEDVILFRPLVMGAPWLEQGNTIPDFEIMFFGYDYFENFIEDIDEFERVRDFQTPTSPDPMREISEYAFKQCLAQILGDATSSDWGGEKSDYYSSHLHLHGRRVTAAFLLKGPAQFAPMNLNHLGKNNDQIVRLAEEPADVLVVQHSHDILSAVRSTLRAFAVQPSRPRRYCLIDGRDSLRLLQAYDLYEYAVELSNSS